MKPLYLHISNFTCHSISEIDFTSFSSALIIGQKNNSERKSNGVGKTSIFKAIEYVLFNQVRDPLQEKDVILEDLLLEGAEKCRVIFDFSVDENIYRVVRSRTIRGVSDLSFYRRSTTQNGQNAHISETNKQLWTDISSRRTQDTEADLIKIIKIHHKAFINTAYFMQFDFGSGLAAATPTHRKAILRETLDLLVYAKLEKVAKTNLDNLSKEIEKKRTILSALGNPDKDKDNLSDQYRVVAGELITKQKEYDVLNFNLLDWKQKLDERRADKNRLIDQYASVLSKQNALQSEINSIIGSINEYKNKKQDIQASALTSVAEIKKYQKIKEPLENIDFSQIEQLKTNNADANITYATIKTQLTGLQLQLDELNIPLPSDGTCKHCRQPLSDAHRQACLKDIEQQTLSLKIKIKALRDEAAAIIRQQSDCIAILKDLEYKHRTFNDAVLQISSLDKQMNSKKELYNEYSSIKNKFQSDLDLKNKELETVKIEIQNSSGPELEKMDNEIKEHEQKVMDFNGRCLAAERLLRDARVKKDVLLHNIEEKQKLINQKNELLESIMELDNKCAMYPSVIQSFGSTGIPALIIQNMLEDLQSETNQLLMQLHPGLQLSFQIEKIKDDGSKDDTLEIEYFLNNKPRKYSMLSGGQKVCAMFSLKLGLSFLLQKMLGSQISLLLIDEIDQPFDDDGVDAFANIIKYFQKEFTTIVITHRNSLKEQFRNIILVEQNQDMISSAKLLSV